MLLELGHDRGVLTSSLRGPFRFNLRLFPRMPVGSASPAYIGVLDEFPYWNAVFDLYRRDEVQPAVELLEKIGIGMYGDYSVPGDIIYLEAATSADSEIIRVTDHLEIEVIREQLQFDFDTFAKAIATEYPRVCDFFGVLTPPVDTLLTVLLEKAEIPTAALRDGYTTPKSSYGKICLPNSGSIDALVEGFARCLLYQFGFEASSGLSDLWLLEATNALRKPDLAGGTVNFTEAEELDHAIANVGDGDEDLKRVWLARKACWIIGDYLLKIGPPDKLIRCLADHREHIAGNATGHTLHKTYGMYGKEILCR